MDSEGQLVGKIVVETPHKFRRRMESPVAKKVQDTPLGWRIIHLLSFVHKQVECIFIKVLSGRDSHIHGFGSRLRCCLFR